MTYHACVRLDNIRSAFLTCVRWVVLALACVLFFPAAAFARGTVYVDYHITTDTVWSGDNDYVICYLPSGGFTPHITPAVAPGVTLTIQSGARVLLAYSPPNPINVNGMNYHPVSEFAINGNIVANGVTFTGLTIDAIQYRWYGIRLKPTAPGVPVNGSFTNCVFERGGEENTGMLGGYEDALDAGVSEVNLTVTNCTFQDSYAGTPRQGVGISYGNGYHGPGQGTVVITGTTFQRLGTAISTDNNSSATTRDPIDITVDNCSFTELCKNADDSTAVNIRDGRNIVFTDNSLSNNGDGASAHPAVVFSYGTSNWPQDIVFDGNTIDGGGAAVDYPVHFHSSSRINALLSGATNTLANIPEAMRYAVIRGTVRVAGAAWGETGIDYLLPQTVNIGQQETTYGGNQTESLTILAGTTIAMPDGVVLKVYTDFSAIGTAAKPVTFRAKGAITNPTRIDITNLADSLTLRNCVLDGLTQGVYGDLEVDTYHSKPESLTIESCTFRNMTGSGMELAVKGQFLPGSAVVRDSVFEDNGGHGYRAWAPYADRWASSCVTLTRCIFRNNAGTGAYLDAAHQTRIENCLIYGNGGNGVTVANNMRAATGGSAPAIVNTTIARNSGWGVESTRTPPVPETANGPYITNSILSGNTRGDLGVAFGDDGLTTYSCVTVTSRPLGVECIKVDPLFVLPAGGDFRLKSASGRWNGSAWVNDAVTSPCINTGDPNSDATLEPAPNGSIINMGYDGNTDRASKLAGTAPPARIVSFSAVSGGHDSVIVTWSAAVGAQGYQLYRTASWNGTFELLGEYTGTSYTDTGLTTGATYYYRIRPYLNSGGVPVYGGYASATGAAQLAIPVGVTAVSAGPTSVKLTWTAVEGATGYDVWRYSTTTWNSQASVHVGETAVPEITATGLPAGVTWYYKVRAYCDVDGEKVYGFLTDYVAGTPGGAVVAPPGGPVVAPPTGPVLSPATLWKPKAPSKMRRGKYSTISGYVAPKHASGKYLVTLMFYKRDASGVYVYQHSKSAKRYKYSSKKTLYKAKVKLAKGKWRVQAYHSDSGHAPSYSAFDYITVK